VVEKRCILVCSKVFSAREIEYINSGVLTGLFQQQMILVP